jgi:DNA-binding transcriptional LysR family regulator
MNLRWVVLFATVATEESFSRAAVRLNLAQPWLSAQIRKLELELGISLFRRSSSGIELTPEGRALLPFALQISEAAAKFRSLARTMDAQQLRFVRIGSHVPAYALANFLEINDTFSQLHPDYSLTIDQSSTPELLSQLRSRQIHIALVLGPFESSDLECLTVETGQPYLLVPRPRQASESLSLDLTGLQVAVPPEELQPEFFRPLFAALTDHGAIICPAPEADGAAMRQLAQTRRTAVLMIEGLKSELSRGDDLEAVPIDGPQAAHVLVRLKGEDYGRAALHYWSLAKSLLAPLNLVSGN